MGDVRHFGVGRFGTASESSGSAMGWLVWQNLLCFLRASVRDFYFFFNRWLQRISRILAVLGYEGIKQATPVVLRPKRKSSAHSL